MANGRISRLSAFSDILKEDGKRRLSNARRDSKISVTDLEARTTDVEARTIEGRLWLNINFFKWQKMMRHHGLVFGSEYIPKII